MAGVAGIIWGVDKTQSNAFRIGETKERQLARKKRSRTDSLTTDEIEKKREKVQAIDDDVILQVERSVSAAAPLAGKKSIAYSAMS